MRVTLLTHLSIEECQKRLADPQAFEGTRLRGDALAGAAIDRVSPYELRVKWRWGPLYPFFFAATMRRAGETTGIEGRLSPHQLLEAALGLSAFFPEWIILPLAGLAVLFTFALGCCAYMSWFLAAASILAGFSSMILGGRRLYRRAERDVLRVLHDTIHASPKTD